MMKSIANSIAARPVPQPNDSPPVAGGEEAPRSSPLAAFTNVRFMLLIGVLALLTFWAVKEQDVLLSKRLVLSPADSTRFLASTYDDRINGGHSVLTVDPDTPLAFSCDLKPGFPNPFCAMELVLSDPTGRHGIDLSSYDAVTVDISYRGPSPGFRIFVKQFDPRFSIPNRRETSEFHQVEIPGTGRVVRSFALKDVGLADWWLAQRGRAAEAAQTKFDNVIAVDVTTASQSTPGRHAFQIHSFTFRRLIMSPDAFHLLLVGCWAFIIALLLVHRTSSFRRHFAHERALQRRESERLEAARVAAENASTAKSEFLSNMSHELRTPLNAIMGYARLLEPVQTTPQYAAAARTIHDSGAHLLTLITDILDLAKIEAGKLELVPATFDLRACLRGVGDMIRIKADEKNLGFACTVTPAVPRLVVGDEKRIRQVLINLLDNGVKFTGAGTVTLAVDCPARVGRNAMISFEIRDTGIGLSDEEQTIVFRPFEQTGDARRRATGTGLGLSISRQLVGLMHGRIDVESVKGIGSCFSFQLALPTADKPAASAAPAADICGYKGARRRLLIVDDTAANRSVLAQTLHAFGFDTEQAANGEEALTAVEAFPPDLVLMDLRMPVMDGYEATRRLRARKQFAGLPIVAISASVTREVEAQSRAAGVDHFLGKPIDVDELIVTLGRLLGLEWIRTGNEGDAPAAEAPMVAPPQQQLETLLHLARAGNMKAIVAEADAVDALGPDFAPFAERLRGLARAYQSPALLRLIESYSEPREAA